MEVFDKFGSTIAYIIVMDKNTYTIKRVILGLFLALSVFAVPNLHAKTKAFTSKKAMMKQLYTLGYDHIYKIQYNNKMKILVLNEDGEMQSQRIASYGDIVDVPRVPELDYIAKNKIVTKAYRIGDTMLCYQPGYFSMMLGKVTSRISFKTCYMFPNKILSIVDALSQ